MTDVVKQYRSVEIPVPARNRSWFLYGAGMENLGRDRKPVEHDMEIPGPDELLVRCDATCLCFSDVKIINQGGDHLRIRRDLSREPTVMGHESAVTVVRVGTDVQDRFKVGERYVVQADVYINGQTRAYGYALPGALRQYNILNWEVLNGDDGCYLIPVDESTGYAEAALSEPWACVVHSYRLEYRQMVKPGGVCLMVGGVGAEKLIVGNTFQAGVPGRIVAANLPEGLMRSVRETGCGVTELRLGEIDDTDALVERFTDGSGFDDIIVCGKSDPDRLEALAGKLSRGGVFNIVCGEPVGRPLSIDVGRVHYEEWYYTGNPGPDIGASYASHRSPTELKPGGTTWMMGAGGPMGQMHVQRACEMPAGPSTIVATDIDANRLQELQDRFTPASEASGRRLILLNPNELAADEPGLFTDISRLPHPSTGSGCGLLDGAGFQIRPHQGGCSPKQLLMHNPDEFEERLQGVTGGRGFDDVVAMVPVPALIEQAASYLADGGLLNIFAGVVRGTRCDLPIEDVYLRNVRWVGSSGSFISDMRETLRMAESGELMTANAVMAVGGLDAVYHGLELVKSQAVPGKIVIYPMIENLPITLLSDLNQTLPSVAAKLRDGRYWSREAEEELLRLKLS